MPAKKHIRTLAYRRLGSSIFPGGITREERLERLEETLPDENTTYPSSSTWLGVAFDPYLSPENYEYAIFEDKGKCVIHWFSGPQAEYCSQVVKKIRAANQQGGDAQVQQSSTDLPEF